MAKVQVTNVTVLDNPTAFFNPFQFEITFECLEDLPDGEYVVSTCENMDICVVSLARETRMFIYLAM